METKRANFEITPEQEASLLRLKQLPNAPSIKETVLRSSSSRVMLFLASEMSRGKRLYLGESSEKATRVALPDINLPFGWMWLKQRPHKWRRQLWAKGRLLESDEKRRQLADAGVNLEAVH